MRLEDYDDDDCMVYVGVNYSVRLPGTALWPGGGGSLFLMTSAAPGLCGFFPDFCLLCELR
jgi:hypothetical protein